jgi:hypothetical protein
MSIVNRQIEFYQSTADGEILSVTGKVLDKYRGNTHIHQTRISMDMYLVETTGGRLTHVRPTDITRVLDF